MSGIVGICHLGGAPVDVRLLARMTNFLAFRGPDALEIHAEGPIGFGHTLLKTTDEAEHEHQPFSLDGRVWIVADARIDARGDLIANLEAQRMAAGFDAPDVELILRAYLAWGETCVEKLLGDFAFGIWDARQQRLFCARDHMGVKPFYYAHLGDCVVFSNTLDCIRMHPAVSDRLNDLAIADFLLFEYNRNSATTSFADIQRLAPAHCASWDRNGVHLRRYWSLPVEEPLFYSRLDDYTDHFRDLARTAVNDRLRTSRVGILMSGGLDSTTMAATAAELIRKRGAGAELGAFTFLGDYGPIDDEERRCAGLVAASLGIPIQFMTAPETGVTAPGTGRPSRAPEPVGISMDLAPETEPDNRFSSYARVFLYGEGPDNALFYEWRPYFSSLFRQRRFGRLLGDVYRHVVLHRELPLPSAVLRRGPPDRSAEGGRPQFPEWINPELESRLQLRARWELIMSSPLTFDTPVVHPIRPRGYASFHFPLWQEAFEGQDPGRTRSLHEVRTPFVDVRMLRFLLRVPPVPWCRGKYLVRRAMRGSLPEPVLQRVKRGYPPVGSKERKSVPEPGSLLAAPNLAKFVEHWRLSGKVDKNPWVLGNDLRVRCLNHWLQNSWRYQYLQKEEEICLTRNRIHQ